jgi:hypothetical protein
MPRRGLSISPIQGEATVKDITTIGVNLAKKVANVIPTPGAGRPVENGLLGPPFNAGWVYTGNDLEIVTSVPAYLLDACIGLILARVPLVILPDRVALHS